MLSFLLSVIKRDLKIAYRRRSDVIVNLLFFIVVSSLFPLGVGPESSTLNLIGPGVVWISALLSSILSLHRLFVSDFNDGVLEQYVLSPHPFAIIVTGKIIAYWLLSGLPLVFIAPLIGFQFGLSFDANFVLFTSLLLGTPVMSLIGAIGAALTLGVRSSGVLVALLILPLYIPILIFGAGAVSMHASGIDISGYFFLMAGLLLCALAVVPFIVAFSLKIVFE
ncbi:heme exporter protein CcmB [Undibacterium sp. Ji22W]|uniref:heme exporter protein CcmB n=1 Tax=Undibacterium sp. Ji22W TaxID=3413038 RepID=UPI003BF276B6